MNENPAVERWFESYDNPMKDAVRRVRAVVLGADARVTEAIKWKAPTFVYKGNIASFFPKARLHVSLMFHQGASIPGRHPILEGDGELARVAKFASLAEVEKKRKALEAVVKAWCEMKDGR